MSQLPIIAIPCDVKRVGIQPFHAVGEKYINAVAHGAGSLPVLLPALSAGADLQSFDGVLALDELADRFDGIFLPGSVSNVAPEIYGSDLAFSDEYLDPQRDATTLELIRVAVDKGIPLLAICRGFQEMNVAFGGTLHQHVHDVPGLQDHREDKSLPRSEQYGPAHSVELRLGGVLHKLVDRSVVEVNSLHGQGLDQLGDRLVVEAAAPDGLIEAFCVAGAKSLAVGIQWHAEWRYWEDELSSALFKAFGTAARERAAAR